MYKGGVAVQGGVTRRSIVFGVDNQFGEEIIGGLAAENHDIILCGERNDQNLRLLNRFPEHIKGFCARDTNDYHKHVQVTIESQGSLDALIYLIRTRSARPFPEQSGNEVESLFQYSLIEPINMFRAVLPYLNKSTGCKVIFIDSDAFMPDADPAPLSSCNRMVLSEFCKTVSKDLANKPVEIRTLFSADQLMSRDMPEDILVKTRLRDRASQESIPGYTLLAEKIQEVLRPAIDPVSGLQGAPSFSVS